MDKVDYEKFTTTEITEEDMSYWYGSIDTKPQIEKDLFDLQEKFFAEKDTYKRQQWWSKMFTRSLDYSRSFVKQRLKHKKFLDPDIIEDYAVNATHAFMQQYIYRPDFKCIASFGGMIQPKVVESMYRHEDDEKNLSLEGAMVGKDNEEMNMSDYSTALGAESIFYNKTQLDNDPLHSLLKQGHGLKKCLKVICDEIINNDEITLPEKSKVFAYLRIVLERPSNRHVKPGFLKYICKSKKEMDLCEWCELSLFNMLQEYEDETTI